MCLIFASLKRFILNRDATITLINDFLSGQFWILEEPAASFDNGIKLISKAVVKLCPLVLLTDFKIDALNDLLDAQI